MTPEPQIVVTFHPQLEKFIERGLAGSSPDAKPRVRFVIVAVCAREPVRSERSTERAEWAERVGKLAARAGLRRGIQSEAALWNARESSLGAEPAGERGCASEKRALGGRERATNVAEIAAGGFRARAPTPAAVHNGVNFHARRDSAQVQIGERGSDPEESLRQVPVFIARVSVDTQPQAGITEDGRGKGEEKAALLRIPPHERGEIQGAMSQIVHFRVKRGVGHAGHAL